MKYTAMPFKTRSRKISAAQRRFSFTSDGTINYGEAIKKPVKDLPSPSSQLKTKRIGESYQYVRQDLMKILLIAGAIIGAQVLMKLANAQNFFLR